MKNFHIVDSNDNRLISFKKAKSKLNRRTY